jgi:hypothetical protein
VQLAAAGLGMRTETRIPATSTAATNMDLLFIHLSFCAGVAGMAKLLFKPLRKKRTI